jgi:hypothetical protein
MNKLEINHLYPNNGYKLLKAEFIKSDPGELRGFASYFNTGVSFCNCFYAEMVDYLEPIPGEALDDPNFLNNWE